MQMRRDEGECPEQQRAFQEYRHQHDSCPWSREHLPKFRDGPRQRGTFRLARAPREGGQSAVKAKQQCSNRDEDCGDSEKRYAPAQVVGRESARQHTCRNAENLSCQKACKNRLTLAVRHHVADPRRRQRNDCGRRRPGKNPSDEKPRKRGRETAQRRADRARDARPGHDDVLAETITHRPEKKLRQAVRHGKSRDHVRCVAEGQGELRRKAWQQRIAHAQRRRASECRKGQGEKGGERDGRTFSAAAHRRRIRAS